MMIRSDKVLDRQCVPTGTVIIEQGTMGSRAYLIEKGRVEVLTRDAAGKEMKVAEVGRGALIGEMAIIADGVRTATVRALEETTLIALSAHDLQEAMNASGSMHKKLMRLAMDRMKETQRKILGRELSDIEKTARMTIDTLAQHIPEDQREYFKKGALPLLDKLQTTLEGFGQG